MAVSVTHNTPADGTFSAGGQAAWDEAHAVAGLGTMAEEAAADYLTKAGNLSGIADAAAARTAIGAGTSSFDPASPGAIGGTTPAAITGTVITASTRFALPDGTSTVQALKWGTGGAGFYRTGSVNVTLSSNAGTNFFTLDIGLGTLAVRSDGGFGWCSTTSSAGTVDSVISRAGAANSVIFGGSASVVMQAAATSRTEINKTVTAFTDAVAKATFTVTIPNGNHTATLEFEFTGFLGAGGAIGVNEAAASTSVKVIVTRTTGLNAVASAVSAAFGAVAANVAGANTVTVVAAVSAIAGAAGATNTFTLDVTIDSNAGASANHVCLCYAKLMNANASGVTIS